MSGNDPASQAGIYEPLLPPLHQPSDTDRGAYALLTAVIMVVLTGLMFLVKSYMTLSTFRKARWDDLALTSAMALAIGYTISICRAVDNGLGTVARDLTNTQVQSLSQHYYSSNILLYLSLASAKCSIALLIIAIEPKGWIVKTLYGVLATTAAWVTAAVFLVALQCGPTRWVMGPTSDDTCINQYSAQIALKTIDIITDLVLSLLPAIMVAYVQVTPFKRFVVSLMFGLRIVTPILTAISLARLSEFYDANTEDRPFAAATPSIWTTVALSASIVTVCLPSIKRFLNDWAAGINNAGLLEPFDAQVSDQLKSGQHSGLAATDTRRSAAINAHSRHMHNRLDDDTESKEGLTDGILRVVDIDVDSEGVSTGREGRTSPGASYDDRMGLGAQINGSTTTGVRAEPPGNKNGYIRFGAGRKDDMRHP